jgi:hypothetical protein
MSKRFLTGVQVLSIFGALLAMFQVAEASTGAASIK